MPYKNKEDQRNYQKRHYRNNKEVYKGRAKEFGKKSRKRNSKWVFDYLSSHPCVDCGEPDVIVLEFDHVKDFKKDNISDLVSNGYSLKTIQAEIEKCEVRCANCHRRVTYKRRIDTSLLPNQTSEIAELQYSLFNQ